MKEDSKHSQKEEEKHSQVHSRQLDLKQSSLRSLKELQQRKKFRSILSSTDQQQLLDLATQNEPQRFKSLLEQSFHSQKLMKNQQIADILPKMNDQSEKNLIVQEALRKSSTLIRKRSHSPSQQHERRNSMPVTPKKNLNDITVPNLGGQESYNQLMLLGQKGNAARNYKQLNLSTVQAAQDINLFPSLSHTPKFDLKGGIRALHQGNEVPQTLQINQTSLNLQVRQQRIQQSVKSFGSRKILMGSGSKSQSRIKERQGMPGGQAWQDSSVNQFKIRDAKPIEVVQQLESLVSQSLGLLFLKPEDLDSTEPLDSFLDSIFNIVDSQLLQYKPQQTTQTQFHLATGIRTEICEDLLSYICALQNRNKFFVDSVEYFTEHITRLNSLEQEKYELYDQVKVLKQEKEDLFLQKYDLDRKLSEAGKNFDVMITKEKGLLKQIKNLDAKLKSKTEECESLSFRVRHMQDLDNMMEPPMTSQSLGQEVNGQSDPAQIDINHSAFNNETPQFQAEERARGLEAVNKRLQIELQIMKEAIQKQQEMKFTDNVDHFVRIQELFNKIQIENKQLRVNSAKMESKLESKEKLISHLEGRVTSVMVEKEEVIVKLKAEIVLLKNQIELSDKTFKDRLQSSEDKFSKQLHSQYQQQIQNLEQEKAEYKKEKELQIQRITQLQQDYDQFTAEFENYRQEISQKESENMNILKGLQQKLQAANGLNEQISSEKQASIDTLENQLQVLKTQLNIQNLKIEFIQESTKTLVKQKHFLLQDLQSSQIKLSSEIQKAEQEAVSAQSGDYLISVKKALKQSQGMVELGLHALQSAAQIAEFWKVEEMMQMIEDQEKGVRGLEEIKKEQLKANILQNQNEIDTLNQEVGEVPINENENYIYSNVQSQINFTIEAKNIFNQKRNSQTPHIEPLNSLRIRKFIQNTNENLQISERNEEHYIVYCPIELASTLIKLLVELLQTSGVAQSEEQLPRPLQNLLAIAYQKSDLTIEQEIMQRSLLESKQLLQDRYLQLISEVQSLKQQLEFTSGQMSEDQQQRFYSNFASSAASQNLDLAQVQNADRNSQVQSPSDRRQTLEKKLTIPLNNINMTNPNIVIQKEGQSLNNVEYLQSTNQSHRKSTRKQRLDEISQLKLEVESQKLSMQEYKERSKDLQLQLASKIVLLEEQLETLNSQHIQELRLLEETHKLELDKSKQGIQQREASFVAKINELRLQGQDKNQQIQELAAQVAELQNKLSFLKQEMEQFDKKLFEKGLEYEAYKENVQAYTNLKLKFYLNKCLKIDKSKFRFLSTEENLYDLEGFRKSKYDNESTVTVLKLIIEIIDDQQNPLYLFVCLGQMGLNANDKLNEYHLLIQDEEFLISILRHKTNPLNFKIIATSFNEGTEYILELNERDIFELTEGDNSVLEKEEPQVLLDLIVKNLILISKDQGIRILTCENKVFFNNLFHDKYVETKPINSQNKDYLIDNFLKNSQTQNKEKTHFQYRNLQIRNEQIKQHIQNKTGHIKEEYRNRIKINQEIQTEFEGSLLYEGLTLQYNGNHRLGKQLEFKVQIKSGASKSTQLTFEEIRTKEKAKVVFYDLTQNQTAGNYVIYSECLKIKDSQQIMISAEKLQQDGFLIKLHDLKDLASDEFFLIKKSNNSYVKLNRNAGLDFVMKEEFRNLMFDLTFAINIPSSQVLIANMAFQQEQAQMKDELYPYDYDQMAQVLSPPTRKRSGQVQQLQPQIFQEQFLLISQFRAVNEQSSNILLQKHERGQLIYRNIYTVRCSFEGADEHEQQAIISFYQKKEQISVEVFLYKDQQKMSIASQVSTEDLFGIGYQDLQFDQKVTMLDQMMEKLYVLSQNQAFHLKVENDAIPISQIVEQRKSALSVDSNTLSMNSIDKMQADQKSKVIDQNRQDYLTEPKSQRFSSFTMLNNKVYDYNVYFLMRLDKISESVSNTSPRKKQSMLKKMMERQSTNLEALIEDNLDYDSLFIEVTDKQNEKYTYYLSQRHLISLLTSNPEEYKNNFSLVGNKNKEKLVEYLKKHTIITEGQMTIENKKYIQNQVIYKYSQYTGGILVNRDEILGKIKDVEQNIISKQLLMNNEVDMSEFIYDVKLYLISDAQNAESCFSYSLEIFALNEPDQVYIYNQPLLTQSAFSFNYEVINLLSRQNYNAERSSDDENIIHQEQLYDLIPDEVKHNNFSQLFAKYLDNRLLLLVSDQAFPRKLTFTLIEPSSRLSWNYQFQPTAISSNLYQGTLGALTLIDNSTLEQILGLILKQKELKYSSQDSSKIVQVTDSWVQIDEESSQAEMYLLGKGKGFKIFKSNQESIIIRISQEKNEQIIRPQSSSSQVEIQDEPQKIEIALNLGTLQENRSIMQLIQSSGEARNIFCCDATKNSFKIALLDFESQEPVFVFNFTEQNEQQEQESSSKISLEQAIMQGLQQIFGVNTLEQTLKTLNYEQQLKEKSLDPYLSVPLQFKRKKALLGLFDHSVTTLHRKTFFDEAQDKLIIVSIQKHHENIEVLNLVINEPETKTLTEIKFSLKECFTEEEMIGLDLHKIEGDISQLKKLAKIIVEERAVIKRVNEEYQVELGPQGIASNPNININISGDLDDSFEENQKIMEEMRKQNNKSAKGKRKPQYMSPSGAANSIKEEEDEMDEESQEAAIPQKGSFQKITGNSQQQKVLNQSIIEEEASQDEVDDSPPRLNQQNSQDIVTDHKQSIGLGDGHNFEEEEPSKGNFVEMEEDEDNQSEYSQIFKKEMGRGYILEVITKENQEHEKLYRARKIYKLDGSIAVERIFGEAEVLNMISHLANEEMDLHEKIDALIQALSLTEEFK